MKFPPKPDLAALEGRTIFGERMPNPTRKRPTEPIVGPNSAKDTADMRAQLAGRAGEPPYDPKLNTMLRQEDDVISGR